MRAELGVEDARSETRRRMYLFVQRLLCEDGQFYRVGLVDCILRAPIKGDGV